VSTNIIGGDVVEDALFEVSRKPETFDDNLSFGAMAIPEMAPNRCIDFLRSGELRGEADTAAMARTGSCPWQAAQDESKGNSSPHRSVHAERSGVRDSRTPTTKADRWMDEIK
jgi:DNA-directed RNA polymerase specialized sigma24 family protein